MEELTKYKLGEIAKIYNGSTPSTLDASNYDGDIIWATPKDLSDQNSKYFSKGARNITQKGFDSCSTQMIPANNILMSSRAPIGLFAINTVDCCTNQGFKNIVLDKAIADVDFMYYFLKYHVKDIEALGSGTTFREVSKTAFEKYEISIPSLPTQQKIASVLSKLDRKISVNREINRNLEELAKQIYDYWFVQFDFPNEEGKPYKSSGGKMVWNETLKRKIPADWEVKKLNACLKHINTGLNPRDNFVLGNGTIKYITVKNLTTDGTIDFSGCDLIDENARTIVHERSKISKGDILFASISPLGRCYIIQEQPEKWDINESVFSIRPNQKIITPEYLYCYLTSEWFMKKAEKEATGSIFAGIRMAALNAMTIIVPDEKVLKRFSSLIKPIFGQKDKSFNGIQHLTKLRDELLPLLMNGQVPLNSCLSAD